MAPSSFSSIASASSSHQINGNGKRKRNDIDVQNQNQSSSSQHQQNHSFQSFSSQSNSNGFHHDESNQDQDQDQEEVEMNFDPQEQEQEQEPSSSSSSSRYANKSKPRTKTTFGGSKRKKGKGKNNSNLNSNSNLQDSDISMDGFQTTDQGEDPNGNGNRNPSEKKIGLAKLNRPLLELDVIPTLRDHVQNGNAEGEDQDFKLWLKDDDKRKLQLVISSLDPSLLDEPLPNLNSSEENEAVEQHVPSLTLDQALQIESEGKGIDLKELVLRLSASRQPLLKSSSLAELDDQIEEEEDGNEDYSIETKIQDSKEREREKENGSEEFQLKLKDPKILERERIRLSNFTLIISLLEDLAFQYRNQDEKFRERFSSKKKEDSRNGIDDDDEEDEDDDEEELAALLGLREPKKKKSVQFIRKNDEKIRKFALHMRLPDGDYFTNAVELNDEMIEELDSGNADLIEILPESQQTSNFQRIPTLGSRLQLNSSLLPPRLTSTQIKERKHDVLIPVKSTSYGEFSSFLPSYDSRNSSMSLSASELVSTYKNDERRLRNIESWNDPEGVKAEEWRYRNKIRNRNNINSIEELIEEPPLAPISTKSESDNSTNTPSLEELLTKPLSNDIDVELLKSSAIQLDIEEQIRKELIQNSKLIEKLQFLQWERLKREYSRKRNQDLKISNAIKNLPRTNGKNEVKEKDLLKLIKRIKNEEKVESNVGKEEKLISKELLKSLTKLISSHSSSSSSSTYEEKLIPNIKTLRSLASSSSIISSIDGNNTPKGFWGTLEKSFFNEENDDDNDDDDEEEIVSNVIVDNQTFRLTKDCEELSKLEAEKNGLIIGITKDRNSGLLDRIADSKKYDEKNDKHNHIEPSIQIQNTIQNIPTQQSFNHQQNRYRQQQQQRQQIPQNRAGIQRSNSQNNVPFNRFNTSNIGSIPSRNFNQNQNSSMNYNGSQSPTKSPGINSSSSSSSIPFQQSGVGSQRYPSTPINPASRLGSGQSNSGYKPSYQINTPNPNSNFNSASNVNQRGVGIHSGNSNSNLNINSTNSSSNLDLSSLDVSSTTQFTNGVGFVLGDGTGNGNGSSNSITYSQMRFPSNVNQTNINHSIPQQQQQQQQSIPTNSGNLNSQFSDPNQQR